MDDFCKSDVIFWNYLFCRMGERITTNRPYHRKNTAVNVAYATRRHFAAFICGQAGCEMVAVSGTGYSMSPSWTNTGALPKLPGMLVFISTLLTCR